MSRTPFVGPGQVACHPKPLNCPPQKKPGFHATASFIEAWLYTTASLLEAWLCGDRLPIKETSLICLQVSDANH